ncbi:unnamed protein product [Triticum turgidum subsp. durum]|uniref:RanBD1 domain-containing protein n=1 Tax=Triticum turgidum subsp. durum TaxID=4567 RepID=A0A9R0S7S7_TRITD|nr:unnamed protein product [Triticum turgidum subsp. durum]
MADPAEHREEEEEAAAAGEEEDTGAQIAPIVKLEEVAITTGEEDEDVLLDMKAKLYRFDKDGGQWKERGTGAVKLLKHKEHALDFADCELKEEMFAIRFGSVENCKKFKDLVDEIAEQQGKNEDKESEEVSSAAELVEKLTVTEVKKEEQTEKVETPAVDDKKDAEE